MVFLYLKYISALAPFMIFLDYHKKENIHIAIKYVIAFYVILFLLFEVFVPLFSIWRLLLFPVLIFLFALISAKIKKNSTQKE